MVPAGSEAVKLLVTYARAIAEEQQSLDTPELQQLVTTHIHDLIAVAAGATRDGHAIAEGRRIRVARLRAIMSDITANLLDCDLTVAVVAQRQRMTPRYLHKLFESEERTFSYLCPQPTPFSRAPDAVRPPIWRSQHQRGGIRCWI